MPFREQVAQLSGACEGDICTEGCGKELCWSIASSERQIKLAFTRYQDDRHERANGGWLTIILGGIEIGLGNADEMGREFIVQYIANLEVHG